MTRERTKHPTRNTFLIAALCAASVGLPFSGPAGAQTTTTTSVASAAGAGSAGPFSFGYVPPGFSVGAQPVENQPAYDDFQSSYRYESKTHDRWAVWVSGFAFPGGNFCSTIPKAFRPTLSRIRLTRPAAIGGAPETRTGTVATVQGGAALATWFFDGDTPRVTVNLPSYETRSNVRALISCASGASVITSGRPTKSQLVGLFADTTDRGAMAMTDYALGANPFISGTTLTGPARSIRVTLAEDPRTDAGMAIAGKNPATVHGHPTLVDRDSAAMSISWIERPGKRITVESATSTLDELVMVGEAIVLGQP
jgi:hypothetical protein